MEIIDRNLKFNGTLTSRKETTILMLHHAAIVNCTVEQIHSSHLQQGWAGIGYHLFIGKDGKIYKGRPIDKVGAHTSGFNTNSIGICFEGNYHEETEMPEAQKQAGKESVSYVMHLYPEITQVISHRDVLATSCPGQYFPFDEIAVGADGPVSMPDSPAQPEIPEPIPGYGPDPAAFIYSISAASSETDKINALQIALTLDGTPVTVDGILGRETESAFKKHTLRIGSRGHLVVYVQKLLIPNQVDAIYGKNTAAAVRAWQSREGKAADSIVGVKTYRGLALDRE